MLKNNNSISDRVIEEYQKEYEESVTRLSDAVKEIFGFKPFIIGPKSKLGDSIFFDTQNRRLYLLRPEDEYYGEPVYKYNDTFTVDDLDNMKRKWFKKDQD